MSKTPNKVQDPTEAAFSAVQEALSAAKNLADDPRPDYAVVEPRLPSPGERPLPRRAANDDRGSVGQILARMQNSPSNAPYWFALAGSVVWAAAVFAVAARYIFSGPTSTLELFGPQMLATLGAVLIPAILFFAAAGMVRRTQELRHAARSMTEVAMLLTQPSDIATDNVSTLGQAIRQELSAVNDGIERAVSRAGELETIVRNELSTLEHAYDDNEQRVRKLVDRLVSEREAISAHADRIGSSIAGAHEAFSTEVRGVAERIDSRHPRRRRPRHVEPHRPWRAHHHRARPRRRRDDRDDRREGRRPARPALHHRHRSQLDAVGFLRAPGARVAPPDRRGERPACRLQPRSHRADGATAPTR